MLRRKQYAQGFTIAEVAITLLVIGVFLSAIIQLHTRIISSVGNAYDRIEQMTTLWSAIVYAHRQEWYQKGEKADNFYSGEDVTVSYARDSIGENSQLHDFTDVGRIDVFTAFEQGEQQERLAMLAYAPPEQEEQEQKGA